MAESIDWMSSISDWYLPLNDPLKGFVYPGPVDINSNSELYEPAREMAVLAGAQQAGDFLLTYGERRYRCNRIPSIDGLWFAMRRMAPDVPDIDKIGIQSTIVRLLRHKCLTKGGIILIAGETGQGKSTTAAALIKSRLIDYESFALTIEDPPEMMLHGSHGKGRCIQTEVHGGKFADAMRGAARAYPSIGNSIMFVGETRDSETAFESLVSASNGHLVVTTIHAFDVVSAIKRYLSLAAGFGGLSEEAAYSSFGSAMRLVMHQNLHFNPDNTRKLEVSFLFSPNGQNGISQKIRSRSVDMLSTDQQNQQMLAGRNDMEGLLKGWNFQTSTRGLMGS